MTEADRTLDVVHEIGARLIPELSERLRRHGLGEIEVRSGDLRLRVSGGAATSAPRPDATPAAAANPSPTPAQSPDGVSSPAVGYFMYGDTLGPGLAVEKGDTLGHVDVLGVRHDVRAPRTGVVRNLVAETGEAVEYGQTLLELEPAR